MSTEAVVISEMAGVAEVLAHAHLTGVNIRAVDLEALVHGSVCRDQSLDVPISED